MHNIICGSSIICTYYLFVLCRRQVAVNASLLHVVYSVRNKFLFVYVTSGFMALVIVSFRH